MCRTKIILECLLVFSCLVFMSIPKTTYATPLNKIQGYVKNSEGVPIEGADIILIEALSDESIITSVTSSSDGYYEVVPNQPGVVYFYVWAPGFASKTTTIEIGADNQTINYTLIPAATLQGVVINADNKPVEGAELKLQYVDIPSFPFVPNICNCDIETDSLGRFRFGNIEPSRKLKVTVSHPDYAPYELPETMLESGESLDLSLILASKLFSISLYPTVTTAELAQDNSVGKIYESETVNRLSREVTQIRYVYDDSVLQLGDHAESLSPQSSQERQGWIRRHPVIFGTLLGFGSGVALGWGVDDDFNTFGKVLFYGGAGAGVGAIVGKVVSEY